jgi:hypothetical protein
MSSLQPLFASAPRIKLYVGTNLVGYAIGFNFNVSVEVQPIFVLGSFEPVALEPTMYNTVTGTMQIMRLTTSATTATNLAASQLQQDAISGNGASTAGVYNANGAGQELLSTDGTGQSNNPLAQGQLFQHLTPSQLLLSQAFYMQMYMKVPNATNSGLEEHAWMAIQNCRITSRNTNISMGQLVNEPLNFQGLLALHNETNLPQFTLDGKINQVNV